MAIHVSNMKELNKALQPVLLKMVDQLANGVYETLNYFLQDYYSGYDPSSYQRRRILQSSWRRNYLEGEFRACAGKILILWTCS